ncbi:hypothetical protein MATL_G00256260 [Megalops atlanticus]|uniref:Uncharacterized protein n=1 Tax=Megalops atlanticus TaxID=7932 RepID=A0A9D3SWD9_MEGAT|nr:hypothetical protein MATL_G00256260 [Megalops atlanticus]
MLKRSSALSVATSESEGVEISERGGVPHATSLVKKSSLQSSSPPCAGAPLSGCCAVHRGTGISPQSAPPSEHADRSRAPARAEQSRSLPGLGRQERGASPSLQ